MTILLFFLILSLLIFVHEFGHFYAARRSGVGVEEFGFGFPPRIIGWRKGNMVWSINLIPFGGFVRLLGENGEHRDDPASFAATPRPKKILILAAGVLMNYLLAWALWSVIFAVGLPSTKDAVPVNQHAIVQNPVVTAYVTDGSPAFQAGLRTGDAIETVDGQKFEKTEQLIQYSSSKQYPSLHIRATRRNTPVPEATITPEPAKDGHQPRYGFGIVEVVNLRYPWYVAPWYGLRSTIQLTGQTFQGFGQLIHRLATSGQVGEDLSGPIGIAVLTGQVSRLGIISILQFVALLSISLAVINFLPLPALDGGRAAFIGIEKLLGRPISQRVEQTFHATGFYLLLLLILLISIRDVQRFSIVSKITNLFGS